MKTWIIATIYLGIMAILFGASPATQDDVEQGSIIQEVDPAEDFSGRGSSHMAREYSDLRRQLMWEQIKWVEESPRHARTDTLDEMIRQLRSLEIPSKSISNEPNEPMPIQADAPLDSVLPEEPQADQETNKAAPEDELVETLEKLDRVVSPLRLADVLYCQGYYDLSFKNYCTAFEQLSEDSVADRQWIMFQKANCRSHSDLNEAIRFYNELIKSFPNSKWTAAANSRLKMIEWTQVNQNKDLPEVEANDTNRQ